MEGLQIHSIGKIERVLLLGLVAILGLVQPEALGGTVATADPGNYAGLSEDAGSSGTGGDPGAAPQSSMPAIMCCDSGGPGASACEVGQGIGLGWPVSEGCGISCRDGYFACCTRGGILARSTCECLPDVWPLYHPPADPGLDLAGRS